jgi:cell division protein FtsL
VNVDLGIWQKLSRLMAALIFAAAILAVIVWYIPLFQQNERMRKEIQSLQGQIRREEQASRRLEQNIKSLREDPRKPWNEWPAKNLATRKRTRR